MYCYKVFHKAKMYLFRQGNKYVTILSRVNKRVANIHVPCINIRHVSRERKILRSQMTEVYAKQRKETDIYYLMTLPRCKQFTHIGKVYVIFLIVYYCKTFLNPITLFVYF